MLINHQLVCNFMDNDLQSSSAYNSSRMLNLLLQTGTTITDQMDLLHEQVKMLAGEVAFCVSSLKRVSEQAVENPGDLHLQVSHLLLL